jgi:TolB protein
VRSRRLALLLLTAALSCGGSDEPVQQASLSRIYIAKADGSGARELQQIAGEDLYATWSPDGKLLAVMARFPDAGTKITIVDPRRLGKVIEGAVRAFVGLEPDESPPAWSPDGRSIAYQTSIDGDADIFIESPFSKGARKPRPFTVNDVNDANPSWSPDGKNLSYVSAASADAPRQDVVVIGLDGKGERRLTDGHVARSPAWSPDGKTIAFATNTGDIWLIDVATEWLTQVPIQTGESDHPTWSPDGKRLAYTTTIGTDSQIVTSMLDGSDRVVISPPEKDCFGPDWSPDGEQIVLSCR